MTMCTDMKLHMQDTEAVASKESRCAGAAKNVIHYLPSETWALATIVTLAGLESAIPIPFSGMSNEGGQYSEKLGNDSLRLHYSPRLINIDEAPPRFESVVHQF